MCPSRPGGSCSVRHRSSLLFLPLRIWSPRGTVRQHSIPTNDPANPPKDAHPPDYPLIPFNTAHLLPSTLINPEKEKPFSKSPEIKTLSSYSCAYLPISSGQGRAGGGEGRGMGQVFPATRYWLAVQPHPCPSRQALRLMDFAVWSIHLPHPHKTPAPSPEDPCLSAHKRDEKPRCCLYPTFFLTS